MEHHPISTGIALLLHRLEIPGLEVVYSDACFSWFQGTFPEPLKQVENSIVCTDGSGLLRDIFNQSYTPERPIPFPSRKCRAAKSRCDQCLNQQWCLAQGKCGDMAPQRFSQWRCWDFQHFDGLFSGNVLFLCLAQLEATSSCYDAMDKSYLVIAVDLIIVTFTVSTCKTVKLPDCEKHLRHRTELQSFQDLF